MPDNTMIVYPEENGVHYFDWIQPRDDDEFVHLGPSEPRPPYGEMDDGWEQAEEDYQAWKNDKNYPEHGDTGL